MESRSMLPWPDRDDLNRLMEWPQRMWAQMMRDVPSVEVADEGDVLCVRVEVPGVDPDDIDVEVTSQQVIVRGEVRQVMNGEGQGVYHSERRYGRFSRTIPLPAAVDADAAQATYKNGLLEVRVPHSGGGRKKLRITQDRPTQH
jgi:HSP20 family protein